MKVEVSTGDGGARRKDAIEAINERHVAVILDAAECPVALDAHDPSGCKLPIVSELNSTERAADLRCADTLCAKSTLSAWTTHCKAGEERVFKCIILEFGPADAAMPAEIEATPARSDHRGHRQSWRLSRHCRRQIRGNFLIRGQRALIAREACFGDI